MKSRGGPVDNYEKVSQRARRKVLDMIFQAQTSHIGSNFSCIDILAVLFGELDLRRDKFILSKGWAAASLYYFLWREGVISTRELNSYCQPGSKFIGLAEPIIREIPAAGGALGIGFSMAAGMARARKLLKKPGWVYVLMSDGEMQCGNVWESARKAAHECLGNLLVFVDRNGFCAMGRTDDILPVAIPDLFGDWAVVTVNGHDHGQIQNAIRTMKCGIDKPKVIVAETRKGFPVSFMTDNNEWHYRVIDKKSYGLAKKELG